MTKPAPAIGHARAMVRFFRDREASLLGKIFVFLVAGYVVFPFDLVPDVLPIIGWLDDLGLASIALWYLTSVSAKYRHPVIDASSSGLVDSHRG